MVEKTLSASTVRRIYDGLGCWYDLPRFDEGRAKTQTLQRSNLAPALHALDVGVGTGWDHVQLAAMAANGVAVALDHSTVILRLTENALPLPPVSRMGALCLSPTNPLAACSPRMSST